MIFDPLSDMLTRIRNGAMVKKTEVRMPYSKVKHAVAAVMAQEGYVASAEKAGEGVRAELRIVLSYENSSPKIRHIGRVSTPGRRAYAGYAKLPIVLSDNGIAIVSTSQGIMTNKEARKRKLGGEVLCEVY